MATNIPPHQAISNHDIDYAGLTGNLPRGRISIAHTDSLE